MSGPHDIGVDTERKDLENKKKEITTKVERMVEIAKNGDPAHNAIVDAAEAQYHGQIWLMDHGFATYLTVKELPETIKALLAEELTKRQSKHSEASNKVRTLKAFGCEIPVEVRDVPRMAGVGALVYIIGKLHGWW